MQLSSFLLSNVSAVWIPIPILLLLLSEGRIIKIRLLISVNRGGNHNNNILICNNNFRRSIELALPITVGRTTLTHSSRHIRLNSKSGTRVLIFQIGLTSNALFVIRCLKTGNYPGWWSTAGMTMWCIWDVSVSTGKGWWLLWEEMGCTNVRLARNPIHPQ